MNSLRIPVLIATHASKWRGFSSFQAKYDSSLFILEEKDNLFLKELRKSLVARNLDEKISLNRLIELSKLGKARDDSSLQEYNELVNQLPNLIHPSTPIGPPDAAKTIYIHGRKLPESEAFPREDASIFGTSRRDQHLIRIRKPKKLNGFIKSPLKNGLNQLKIINTSAGASSKMFYLMDKLADLENALINFTLDKLRSYGFSLVSVPETIPIEIVKACGFPIVSERDQIYKVFNDDENDKNLNLCLAGTSEMSLAAFCAGRNFLTPNKNENIDSDDHITDVVGLCAISKCYRREVSTVESVLYRTHQFKKVEMFCITQSSHLMSEAMFEKILKIQMEILADLELHFRVMEMPSSELGLSAYRKVDIEVWMPGEKFYGEVSSASNCTDYQSRRLSIIWPSENNQTSNNIFAHTLNGTACAIPRIIKAILETHQQADNSILIPQALRPYMDDLEYIRSNNSFELEWIRNFKENL